MKTLGNLAPQKGSAPKRKRVGRGVGSGWGKTSAKGHKGQKARKGGTVAEGFEGGQMPLYRRLPKRGFKNPFRKTYNIVNLGSLAQFEAGSDITVEALSKAGLIHDKKLPVKLLAKGDLGQSLTIKVHKASQAAKAAVEKAGGKVEEI